MSNAGCKAFVDRNTSEQNYCTVLQYLVGLAIIFAILCCSSNWNTLALCDCVTDHQNRVPYEVAIRQGRPMDYNVSLFVPGLNKIDTFENVVTPW